MHARLCTYDLLRCAECALFADCLDAHLQPPRAPCAPHRRTPEAHPTLARQARPTPLGVTPASPVTDRNASPPASGVAGEPTLPIGASHE